MWIRKSNGLYISEDQNYMIQKAKQKWILTNQLTLETYYFTTMRSCKYFVEHKI